MVQSKVGGFGGNTLPGQHKVPFEFVLPAGIPASFRYEYGPAVGRVSYRIKAKCRVRNNDVLDFRGERYVPVFERFPLSLPAPQAFQGTQDVTGCFGSKRGAGFIEVHLNKATAVH